jgi:hypothetical protein
MQLSNKPYSLKSITEFDRLRQLGLRLRILQQMLHSLQLRYPSIVRINKTVS